MKRYRIKSEHEADLFSAVLDLRTTHEVRNFFYDLCTPAELEGLIDRWQVVQLLVKNFSYRKIAEETGVSTATIVRVAKFLNGGFNGYRTIMERRRES